MKETWEALQPDEEKRIKTVMEMDRMEQPEAVSEQREMEDARCMEPSEAELREQQEMDAFSEAAKLGEHRTIYYPERERETDLEKLTKRWEHKLGEYRILCDTRPSGSRYDIFADGKGK